MRRSVCMIVLALPAVAFAQQTPRGPHPMPPSAIVPPPRIESPDAVPAHTFSAKNLTYATPDHQPQNLDIYAPITENNKTEKRPLVVWIHGGGWQAGNKDHCPATALL